MILIQTMFSYMLFYLQSTVGIFNDMKDLFDKCGIDYACIFEEENEDEENVRMKTTIGRVINRCKRSVAIWANEDEMVASLFEGEV